MEKLVARLAVLIVVLCAGLARADVPWTFSDNTRYMALGDSLAAGYGAVPTTQGYAYLLYQGGTFGRITNTIFANSAVPGATSGDVLAYQVPQAVDIAQPHVITLSVGGNDLLEVLNGGDPAAILLQFQSNLEQILGGLRQGLPEAQIYISNLYDIPEITALIPGGLDVILQFNAIVAGVAQAWGVGVADVFSAFEGGTGLLLVERNGASQFEVHPTNAGYRVMAEAFEDAAAQQ
jgi:lysophospholipase L1-like esterase